MDPRRPRLRRVLPRGRTLAYADWHIRHVWMRRLLWLNAAGVLLFSLVRGFAVPHALLDAAPVAVLAVFGQLDRHRRRASAAVSLGLLTASAVVVHVSAATSRPTSTSS